MKRYFVLFILFMGLAFGSAVFAAQEEKKPESKDDYYELYKILVDTVDQVERNYVKEIDRRELIESAIRGVLSKLDPYSSYIGPNEIEQFRTTMESEFGGIGIQPMVEDGNLIIFSPLYGTPAYKAGLMAGDRIVEINGKSTEGLSLSEAVERLKGKEGSSLELTVIHPDSDDKVTVKLVREIIHVETVLGYRRKSDDHWDLFYDSKLRIGYLRMTAFSRDTSSELQRALQQLRDDKMRGLILDLRFNPGGLLNSAVEISDMFISEGRIVSTKGRSVPERSWDAQKPSTFEGFPMAILVNRYSASASEIVSACLQDHQRAVIMGERTWGKGSVQSVIELEDGKSAIKLTTAAYFRPSGKNIHRFPNSTEKDEWGVMPDQGFELKFTDKEIVEMVQDRRERDVLRSDHDGSNGRDNKTQKPKNEFVDKQLQMAVKYITDELSKTDK